MIFDRNTNDLRPSAKISFNLSDVKLPSGKDVFLRAKQNEIIEKYQAARRFMHEIDTDDWGHYFSVRWCDEDKNRASQEYFQYLYKAQWYEAALMFYNSVIDISWVVCYVSAEYYIYLKNKSAPINTETISSIEDAYQALRNAEKNSQTPSAEDNPLIYLRKMCPWFANVIDYIFSFWEEFSSSDIRQNYNFIKHRGALCYLEIQERKPNLFSFHVNGESCPIDIREVQKTVNLEESIECLRVFDNTVLFPYIEGLFEQLEEVVQPSPMVVIV